MTGTEQSSVGELSGSDQREIRAHFSGSAVRVYQAFSNEIADAAITAQTFVAPFSRARTTWIKPSFTWMMHRSGWATKESQYRILAIDMHRTGFEWALRNSCLTRFDAEVHGTPDLWRRSLDSPVRVQWDPGRNLLGERMPWRTIQLGLRQEAVSLYVEHWIKSITDITPSARVIHGLVSAGNLEQARELVPVEQPYPVAADIARNIGASRSSGSDRG